MKKKQLEFEYRDSFLKKNKDYIVLSATFDLEKGNVEEMKQIVSERKKKRIESQPLDMPNAGSVFRNPTGNYAGSLIENANLKGYNMNGAEISKKHANFIVNTGGATGKDIINLINKDELKEKNEQILEKDKDTINNIVDKSKNWYTENKDKIFHKSKKNYESDKNTVKELYDKISN